MDTFRAYCKPTDITAASAAGYVIGYSERSNCTWCMEFYENKGEWLEGNFYVLDYDKNLTWLHGRAYDKDQQSMTFTIWINSDYCKTAIPFCTGFL